MNILLNFCILFWGYIVNEYLCFIGLFFFSFFGYYICVIVYYCFVNLNFGIIYCYILSVGVLYIVLMFRVDC